MAYRWAEAAYVFEALPSIEIARRTGFPAQRISDWANRSAGHRVAWRIQREQHQQRLLKALEKTTKERCQQLITSTLELVEKKINAMKADDGQTQKLTVGDVQKLTDVIGELHNISMLEAPDPASLQAKLRLSHAQVTEKLRAADPLINYDAPSEKPDKATSH